MKVAVLYPNFGRQAYSQKSKPALQQLGYKVYEHPGEEGLRAAIIDFFKMTRNNYDILCKIDNDCVVPQGWMSEIKKIFRNTDVDILSPNVVPSNAAYKYGLDTEKQLGYRAAKIVGGLWCMRAELVRDMVFEDYDVTGIKGAFNILKQIVFTKRPKLGWTTKVTVQDIGHHSGQHPEHIKSQEHKEYSNQVGRQTSWEVSNA